VRRTQLALTALVALGAIAAGTGSAAADDVLLPDPGEDGLLWVTGQTGDGGAVSAGATQYRRTVLTVACKGGGHVRVTMQSLDTQVAEFTVRCPARSAGVGSVTLDQGVVQSGSFGVGIHASKQTIRWALTVAQPR